MSSHNSQKEAKKALRSDIKSRLSQLSTQDLTAQSQKAQNIILNSSQYQNARRVGIYLSMPQSEAQTDILIRDALSSSQAKKVCVPYIYSVKNDDATSKKRTTKVMDMLQLETIEEYAGLEKDGWGIPKLSDQGIEQRENAMGWKGLSSMDADGSRVENESDAAVEGGLDLIVVPAVAFDRKLNRLGHGAGFYDKFLTRNFGDGKSKKPYLFGLCLAEQVVPEGELVMEPWDWRVDAVAVGDGTLLIFVPDLVPSSNLWTCSPCTFSSRNSRSGVASFSARSCSRPEHGSAVPSVRALVASAHDSVQRDLLLIASLSHDKLWIKHTLSPLSNI